MLTVTVLDWSVLALKVGVISFIGVIAAVLFWRLRKTQKQGWWRW